MFRRIIVGDNERVVLIRKRRFQKILGPGEYWLFAPGLEVIIYDLSEPIFASDWTNYLVNERQDIVSTYFDLVETSDSQVAVVYVDGKFNRILGPGVRVLYWRGLVKITWESIDVRSEPEVPRRLLPAVVRSGKAGLAALSLVDEGKRGLLYLDGKLVRELGPGTYGFWTVVQTPRVDVLETRIQSLEINGQEILTKDKVTVRVNVSAIFEVVDAVTARSRLKDAAEYLYRTLQIAVRQTLGTRTLDEILAEKVNIDASVSAEVRREVEVFGIRVGEIALKDIILPGDIREILNQVVTAEKQAQANVIRRREETAATRSLLNTAKLLEENPLMVRLKELETIEKVADKVDKITVLGGLDNLLNQVNFSGR
jgi:regulator of protease activity HflC (stomatin/prohibitin superfamily)